MGFIHDSGASQEGEGQKEWDALSDEERAEYEAQFNASKMLYPGDLLHFRDAADFAAFFGNEQPLPETCAGLHESECRADLESCLDALACNRKLAGEPDGFYYHRTRHFARCTDCQQAEWIAQGFEVERGFPYGDWQATIEERLAETKKRELEKADRSLLRRLQSNEGQQWLKTDGGCEWLTQQREWLRGHEISELRALSEQAV